MSDDLETLLVARVVPLVVRLLAHADIAAAIRSALGIDIAGRTSTETGLLSKSSVARALSISVATVDRHDAAGAPFERVGARKKYDLEARLAWLRERGKFTTRKPSTNGDVDLTSVIARNGLRVVRRSSQ